MCRWAERYLDVQPILSYYICMTDSIIPFDVLETGALELGITLSQEQLFLYDKLARLLIEANGHTNLTRIIDPQDIVNLHYLDSLTCIAAHKPNIKHRAIDVGTGAGFPGLAIKIVDSTLDMTLVDSTGKKIKFVENAIEELRIEHASAQCARAEDLGRNPAYRGQFGTVYARALAAMPIVAELCLPLLKIGGTLVAQKSGDVSAELKSAEQIIKELGGIIVRVADIAIPGTDIARKIILIRKTQWTSNRFPRPYSEIIGSKK